ncbi:MAG TPA: HAD family phosphatase [Candidatus Limnocylindria bacterium]|nr:HAD family phosphatase [Candidatus Limnocylindria bacterium]
MRQERPDAVIFDLDGTLVDTVAARISGWRETLADAGISVSEGLLEPMIGMDGRALAREVAHRAGRTLDDAETERIDRLAGERFDHHNRVPVPLPGAREALDRLDAAGVTWAIATSSRAEQVAASVAALSLRTAPRIVDGSRVPHAKPAPDLLLLAASEVGVEPSRTWYVGDSTWDMRAAAAAGMRPIGVLAGAAVDERALRDAGAASVLHSLAELDVPA